MKTKQEISKKILEQLQLAGLHTLGIDNFKDFTATIPQLVYIDGYKDALDWVLNEQEDK